MVIEKAVKQVYNVYPNFHAEVLEFSIIFFIAAEKGQNKRYL